MCLFFFSCSRRQILHLNVPVGFREFEICEGVEVVGGGSWEGGTDSAEIMLKTV